MRLQQYINEEYLMRMKVGYGAGSTEIFVNPSARDLKELSNRVRFLVSAKTKRVYVWNAMDTLHYDVFVKLKREGEEYGYSYIDPVFIPGIARNKGNKIEMILADTYDDFMPRNYEYDWKFADKYIKGFTLSMKKHKEAWEDTSEWNDML